MDKDGDWRGSQEPATAARPRRTTRGPLRACDPPDPPSPATSPSLGLTKRGGRSGDGRRSREAMPPPPSAVFARPKTRGAAAAAAAAPGPSKPLVLTVKRSPPKEDVERERALRATPAARTSAGGNTVVPRTRPPPEDAPAPATSVPPLPIDPAAAAAGALLLQVPSADPTAAAIEELRAQVASLSTHAACLESRLNEKDAQVASLSSALAAAQAGPRAQGRPASADPDALRVLESQLRTVVTSHNKHAAALENHAAEITLLQGSVRRLAGDVAAAAEAQRLDAHGRMTADAALGSCWEGIKALEGRLVEVKMEVMQEIRKVGEAAYTGGRASWPFGSFELPTPAEEEK